MQLFFHRKTESEVIMFNKFFQICSIANRFGYYLSLTIVSLCLLMEESHAGEPGQYPEDWAKIARHAMAMPMASISGDKVEGFVGTELPPVRDIEKRYASHLTATGVIKDEILDVYVECVGNEDFGKQKLSYRINPEYGYSKDDILFFVYECLKGHIHRGFTYNISVYEKQTLTFNRAVA